MKVITRPHYSAQMKAAMAKMPITVLIGAGQVGKTTLMKNIEINKDNIFLAKEYFSGEMSSC